MSSFIEKVVGDIGDKRRWREHKARIAALPADYREAIDAVERYLMYRGVITRGDTLVSMLEKLADLFAQGASHGVAIRDIVGVDPVLFADLFLAKFSESEWIEKERKRLVSTIERVASDSDSEGRRP